MTILKKLLPYILAAGLSSNICADDFVLSINNNTVIANSTQQVNRYSLEESTDLTDSNSWSEIDNQRGTNSNLVFKIDTNKPCGFYKVKSQYEPVTPMEQLVQYTHDPHQDYPTVLPIVINNYTTNNLKAIINYTEIMNPYGLAYTTDMPFTNNLIPGENIINTTAIWAEGRQGTGGTLFGQVNLEILAQ